MSTAGRRVLVIPTDDEQRVDLYRRLLPILVGLECQLDQMPEGRGVLEVIERTSYDLLVIGFPMQGPEMPALLKSVRWRDSACRRAAVMLVTDRISKRRADAFLNRGVNRVLMNDATDWELESALGDLLHVEPRLSVSLPVKLQLPLAGKTERVVAQSDNLSISGMLIRGRWEVEVGLPVEFELTPPRQSKPVRGTAEVVRPTTREREGLVGFGIRFVRFSDDGRARLAAFVEHRRLAGSAQRRRVDDPITAVRAG